MMPHQGAVQGVSIFDLDKTLTRRATYSLFLIFAVVRLAPWRLALIPVVLVCMAAYKLGAISRKRLKEIMQTLMLGPCISGERIRPVVAAFADEQFARNCYPEGRALIAQEIAAGRKVILATAAHRFYAGAIATRLGIDWIVATESVWDGDNLRARIDGENCYGADKRRLIAQKLTEAGLVRADISVRFFSDDVSDRPTFDWSDEPIVVNPSAKLRTLAQARGWPVLDWRAPR